METYAKGEDGTLEVTAPAEPVKYTVDQIQGEMDVLTANNIADREAIARYKQCIEETQATIDTRDIRIAYLATLLDKAAELNLI